MDIINVLLLCLPLQLINDYYPEYFSATIHMYKGLKEPPATYN